MTFTLKSTTTKTFCKDMQSFARQNNPYFIFKKFFFSIIDIFSNVL